MLVSHKSLKLTSIVFLLANCNRDKKQNLTFAQITLLKKTKLESCQNSRNKVHCFEDLVSVHMLIPSASEM